MLAIQNLRFNLIKNICHRVACAEFTKKLSSEANFDSVEQELFGQTKHKPVANSDEVLKKYRIKSDLKRFSKNRGPKNPRISMESSPKFTTSKPFSKKIKESSHDLIDEQTRLPITVLGFNDSLTNNVFTNIRSKKQRDKNNQIVMEGRRLILEAIECGLIPKIIFFSQREQLNLIQNNIRNIQDLKIYKVPQHDLKVWSTLTTCPGLLGVFDRPESVFKPKNETENLPVTVICDNIREPNNLGSIIRTCAALPCTEVIVLKGCCDPWDTKALRGGCGAQFRISIKDDLIWDDIKDHIPKDSAIFLAESNLGKVNKETIRMEKYSNADVSREHNIVVIGGETHGISQEAYSFLSENGNAGKLLHIPLAEGVDSLNTASALTLILFEIRRKLETLNVEN